MKKMGREKKLSVSQSVIRGCGASAAYPLKKSILHNSPL